MPNTAKVAFVGCTHPHIFARLQLLREWGVEAVGCYDPDAGLTAALERDYGLKAYPSPEAVLDQPGVNWVIIEGWDPDNARYVAAALERGQAVLLEKPGAPNLPAMHALVDAVRAAKPVPFQIGYMLPYGSAMAHARRILDEGVLGPVTLARFHGATPVGGSREIWQSVPGNLGGLMYTDACHVVHLIVRLLGMPQEVRGKILRLPEGETVIAHGFKVDTLSGLGATVEMPVGGLVHEDIGAAVFDYGDKLVTMDLTGWEAHPWVEAWRIELYGANGTLHVGLQPPWYKLYVRNAKAGYEPGWHIWEGFGVTGVGTSLLVDENYTNEMRHMLERVQSWDVDNTRALMEAEAVITLLSAIYDSDRDGAAVRVGLR
jgi:predicted dehydrogenase